MNVMFEIPSHKDIIKRVIVDADTIKGHGYPQIIGEGGQPLQWREDGTLTRTPDSAAA